MRKRWKACWLSWASLTRIVARRIGGSLIYSMRPDPDVHDCLACACNFEEMMIVCYFPWTWFLRTLCWIGRHTMHTLCRMERDCPTSALLRWNMVPVTVSVRVVRFSRNAHQKPVCTFPSRTSGVHLYQQHVDFVRLVPYVHTVNFFETQGSIILPSQSGLPPRECSHA